MAVRAEGGRFNTSKNKFPQIWGLTNNNPTSSTSTKQNNTSATANNCNLKETTAFGKGQKIAIPVKLTDTALKALEEYVKLLNASAAARKRSAAGGASVNNSSSSQNQTSLNNQQQLQQPTIRFPSNDKLGVIRIPTAASHQNNINNSTLRQNGTNSSCSNNSLLSPNSRTDQSSAASDHPNSSRNNPNNPHDLEFYFNLTSNEDAATQQGSVECISSEKGNGTLHSLGPMLERAQVQTSQSQAFSRFGRKMQESKLENEKKSTVFMDRKGPSSARRGIVGNSYKDSLALPNHPQKKSSFVRSSTNNTSSSHHHHQPSNSSSMISSASSSSGRRPASPMMNHRTAGVKSKNNQQNRLSYPSSLENGLTAKHPLLQKAQGQQHQQQGHNPDLMKRPMKERIIHLLAVRPYKKPELLERIRRDGCKEKDKKNITPILQEVSVMKDNTYHLKRTIWNDVSDEWPFYSEQEKQSFRRRKPQNLTPPFSDGSASTCSSGHSPSSTHPASPSPTPPPSMMMPMTGSSSSTGQKRSIHQVNSSMDTTADYSKKRRVSKYIRPPDMTLSPATNQRSPHNHHHMHRSSPLSSMNSPNVMSSGSSSASNSPKSAMFLQLQKEKQAREAREAALAREKEQQLQKEQQAMMDDPAQNCSPTWNTGGNFELPEEEEVEQTPTPQAVAVQVTVSPPRQQKNYNYQEVAAEEQQVPQQQREQHVQQSPKDYEREFFRIANDEQRRRYKEQFNKDFPEYRRLHSVLEAVQRKFTELEVKIRAEVENSPRWKDLKGRIEKEARRVSQDADYLRAKTMVPYLHDKLAHIKGLVYEYDKRRLNNGSTTTTTTSSGDSNNKAKRNNKMAAVH